MMITAWISFYYDACKMVIFQFFSCVYELASYRKKDFSFLSYIRLFICLL